MGGGASGANLSRSGLMSNNRLLQIFCCNSSSSRPRLGWWYLKVVVELSVPKLSHYGWWGRCGSSLSSKMCLVMGILGHHKQPGAGGHGLEGEVQSQGHRQPCDHRGKERSDFLNFFKI